MLLGWNSGAGIEKPLEWEVFPCHLVMSSGFSKCGQSWGSPALPRWLLWLCQCHVAGDNGDPTCGWGRYFSSLYFPSLIQFSANHRPCLACHVPIPSFFPSVLSALMAAFNLGSFPTSQLEFLGAQPHMPHSALTLLDSFRAVPNLSFSAGSPLNLATLEEQGWILLILAFSCVYTNQYNSALCLSNFS